MSNAEKLYVIIPESVFVHDFLAKFEGSGFVYRTVPTTITPTTTLSTKFQAPNNKFQEISNFQCLKIV